MIMNIYVANPEPYPPISLPSTPFTLSLTHWHKMMRYFPMSEPSTQYLHETSRSQPFRMIVKPFLYNDPVI